MVSRSALDRSLLRGVAFTGITKLIGQTASWLSTIVVARLLLPADYAIVGMASWVIGLAALVTEFGIGAAIVAKQRTDAEELRQLNGFSALSGLGATLLLAASAPLVAAFFREPRLVPVVIALAFSFTINALRVVPLAVMQRDLRFARLAQFDGLQSIALAALTLVLAWRGFGYWTLVVAGLASNAITTLVALVRHPVGFAAPTRERLRATLRFSADVVAQRACWYGYSNADFLIAGRVLGAARMGIYSFAWGLAHIVVDKVAQVVLQVTPGVLARVQHDRAELARYFTRVVSALATVCFPLMLGLSLVAPEFVAVALGPKWAPAVTPLRVLAAYSSVWVVNGIAGQMLLVTGLERLGTQLNVAQLVVMPIAFLVGARFGGVAGLAYAWLVVHPAFGAVMLTRVLRALGVRKRAFLRDALRAPATAAAVMAACVLVARAAAAAAHWSPLPTLVVGVAIGASAYAAAFVLGFRAQLGAAVAVLRQR